MQKATSKSKYPFPCVVTSHFDRVLAIQLCKLGLHKVLDELCDYSRVLVRHRSVIHNVNILTSFVKSLNETRYRMENFPVTFAGMTVLAPGA